MRSGEEETAFLNAIIEEMVERFGYARREAADRLAAAVASVEVLVPGGDMLFHETPEFWAKTVHYGRRDFWRNGL